MCQCRHVGAVSSDPTECLSLLGRLVAAGIYQILGLRYCCVHRIWLGALHSVRSSEMLSHIGTRDAVATSSCM